MRVEGDDDVNAVYFFSKLLDSFEDLLVAKVNTIIAAYGDNRIFEFRQC